MSEIQRLDPVQRYGTVIMVPSHDGDYCYLTDLLWYQRQYRMALAINIVVVLVCVVLAGYLVYHKHDPQPVAKVTAEETAKKTELLNGLKAVHEQARAGVETASKVYHSVAKDLDRIKGIEAMNANLKAQIKAQNQLLNPIQQTETLKVAATKMHDGQVAALAREIGFGKIRVVE